ncbi:hypothetical protein [Massilia timonae]|nr:hypothetical protein [Massilia timonae]
MPTWAQILLLSILLSGCWKSVEDQASKLGAREFTAETWATATDLQRGEMTASLLRKHDVTSFHRKEVVALLGAPTGYYDYDTNPAYFVGPTTVESMYGKGYLLVFETDKYNGEVDRVFFLPEVE